MDHLGIGLWIKKLYHSSSLSLSLSLSHQFLCVCEISLTVAGNGIIRAVMRGEDADGNTAKGETSHSWHLIEQGKRKEEEEKEEEK